MCSGVQKQRRSLSERMEGKDFLFILLCFSLVIEVILCAGNNDSCLVCTHLFQVLLDEDFRYFLELPVVN